MAEARIPKNTVSVKFCVFFRFSIQIRAHKLFVRSPLTQISLFLTAPLPQNELFRPRDDSTQVL
jgi:hypothetical protein